MARKFRHSARTRLSEMICLFSAELSDVVSRPLFFSLDLRLYGLYLLFCFGFERRRVMNCWIRFWEIVAIIAYLASSSAFAQQANVEAGKKEGKVGVYGSVVPQAMEG